MGVELELGVLLIVQTVLITAFAKFEIETPFIRKILKWFIIDGITIGLFYFIGHWAMAFPFVGIVPGTIYHFTWCRKNGIDPFKATPRKKYYQLRRWNLND